MRIRDTRFILLLLALATESPALADRPGRFVGSTEVSLVSFEVSVSDRGGPVAGLARDDFLVLHDGVPVALSHFAWYSSPTPGRPETGTAVADAQDEAPAPAAGQRPGFVCVFIDSDNTAPANRTRILPRLIEFVRGRLAAGDRVMVASSGKGLSIVQPFTASTAETLAALDAVGTAPPGSRASLESERRNTEDLIQRIAREARWSVNDSSTATLSGLRSRPETLRQSALHMVQNFARTERHRLLVSTRMLRMLVSHLAPLPGRKTLLYVSDGLPGQPGIELYRCFEAAFGMTSGAASRPDAAEIQGRALIEDLERVAIASGVVLNMVDASGMAVPGADAATRFQGSSAELASKNNQEPMREIAHLTGGRAVVDTNDLEAGLARVTGDLDSYYLLGYPLPPGDGRREHTVEVRVLRDGDHELRYRRRFVERSLPQLVEDHVRAALALALDDAPIALSLSSGTPKKAGKGRIELPIRIGVPIDAFALPDGSGGLACDLTAYVMTQDAEGNQSDTNRIEIAIRVPAAEVGSARGKLWPVAASLVVKPGTYRVSIGVHEQASNLTGYALLDGVLARR